MPNISPETPLETSAPLPGGEAATQTTGSSVLAGSVWSTAARVIPQLYTIVLTIAAARFLGADGLGRQSFIAFVELSVIMLITGGLPIALMRYIGESLGRGEPGAVSVLIPWAWRLEAVAAAIGAGILVAAALLGAAPEAAWVLAGVATALGIAHTVPSALLIGAQRWREASIVGLVTGAVATPAAVAVLWVGGGITGMFAVEAAASVVNLFWTSALARRAGNEIAPVSQPAPGLKRDVLGYAGFASIGVVLTFIVWRRSEFFFLQQSTTCTQIALYSVSFSLVTALVRVFDAVAAVVTPAVATLYGAGELDRIRSGYARAVRLLVLATLPLTAAAIVLGPPAVRLLGDDFDDAGPVLVVMLATFPVIPLVKTSNGLLHGLGRVRFILGAGAFAAVVNVSLDVLLIPPYEAVGAALANGGAQLAAALPVLVYSSRLVGRVEWQPRFLARSAAAAVGVALTAWLASLVGGDAADLVLGSAAGLAALVILAPALRILPPDDARWLDGIAGPRLGGLVGLACRVCAPKSAGSRVAPSEPA